MVRYSDNRSQKQLSSPTIFVCYGNDLTKGPQQVCWGPFSSWYFSPDETDRLS